ncbi:MAG: right-handed parallel beta-helix repeat-containing protein, partial [Planctomycetes bacterium]|nr:right-handed parallel beta-helix repeat-containing protein [Planctomycetota bacterium]
TARIVMAGKGPAFRFVGTHAKGSADPGTFDAKVWRNQRMPMIDGLEFTGTNPEADAVQVDGTMQFTMTRSLIRNVRHGIHLVNRNRNILVSDCHIYHNTGIGIFYDNLSLHQSNIIGCHISYCGGGGVVFRGGDVRNVHIGTCDIESCHAENGPPTANILIDCSGSTNGTAEVAVTGCTIQHNSKGPDSANIRILGRGDAGKNGREQWGHVTITGNVFSDVMCNVHLSGCRDVTLTGNTFWMGYEHNLLVEDCTAIVLAGNVLDRNPAYAYGNAGTTKNAVVFRNSRDCTVSGLHIQGVRGEGVEAGMVVDNCDRFNIHGCTLLDNEPVGLLLRDVKRSRVSDCLIRDDREGVEQSKPMVLINTELD